MKLFAPPLGVEFSSERVGRSLNRSHRSAHEAMLLLDENGDVVADAGPMPSR